MGIHHGTLTLTHTHTEQPRRHAFRIITFILYYGYSMRVTVCISPGISQCVFTYKTECLYKWTVSESLLVFRCSEWVFLIISLLVFFAIFVFFLTPSPTPMCFLFFYIIVVPLLSLSLSHSQPLIQSYIYVWWMSFTPIVCISLCALPLKGDGNAFARTKRAQRWRKKRWWGGRME